MRFQVRLDPHLQDIPHLLYMLLFCELAEDVQAILFDGTSAGGHGVWRWALLRALGVRGARAQHDAACQ